MHGLLFGRTPGQIEEHALEIGRNFGELGHGDAMTDKGGDDVGGERRLVLGLDQIVTPGRYRDRRRCLRIPAIALSAPRIVAPARPR